jgi:hypothetical protein
MLFIPTSTSALALIGLHFSDTGIYSLLHNYNCNSNILGDTIKPNPLKLLEFSDYLKEVLEE